MASVSGTKTTPAVPEKATKETLDPITQAIAKGFDSVLKDVHAMQKEMRGFIASIQREASVTADRMGRIAQVSTGKSGLRPPAGISQSEAAHMAVISRGTQHATHRASPAHLAPGIAPPSDIAPSIALPARDADAFQTAYTNSVQTMRASIASRVTQRAQNWVGAEGIMVDPRDKNVFYYTQPDITWDGTRWVNQRTGKFVSQKEMDVHRVVKTPGFTQDKNGRWRNDATGRMASPAEVQRASTGWDEVAKFQRKTQITGSITDAANAWASGQGLGRSLLSALPADKAAMLGKAAGIAGAAYMGARKAVDWSQEQYVKGRDVSQYTGGSAWEGWKDATRDQFESWKQSWNPFGPGAGDYMAFAQRANQFGMRGDRKRQFVNTGLDIMGSMSIGSEEVTRIMSTVVAAGQSLTGLKTALVGVTKAAREAGISAMEARQRFEQNFGNLKNTFGVSGQTMQNATVLTNVQSQQGQGSTLGEISTSWSVSSLSAIAASKGMTYQQYSVGIANGTVVPDADRDKMAQSQLAQIGFTKSEVMAFISNYEKPNRAGATRKYPVGDPTTSPDAEAKKANMNWFGSKGFHPVTILNILKYVGYENLPDPNAQGGLAPGDIYHYAICVVMDRGLGGQALEAATTAQNNLSPTTDYLDIYPVEAPVSGTAGRSALDTLNASYSQWAGATGESGVPWTKETTAQDLPVVRKFIEEMAMGKYGGDVDLTSNMVMVKDSTGKFIPVSAATAVAQYSDQIQSNVAYFGAGANEAVAGKTLAEVSGYIAGAPGSEGVLKVEAKPELLEWFRIYHERVPVPTT